MSERRILVTSALPYANGHIHIGHLVEYIQTDIWARFQRLRGHRCIYMCADDTHGTAIMIRARQEGRSETELIADMSAAHQRDFAEFQIAFDHYGSTDSDANRELCASVWRALRKGGMVAEREIEQLYDPQAGTFLADRFVTGSCPKCGAADQYGDSCDKCGATYSPADLVDPRSTLSGATPELRTAQHLFVEIERLHDWLEHWVAADNHLQDEVVNYLKGHFLSQPLRDWDISRPAPYFGFEIPDAPGNYWYVWFDAPIGYMAATHEWCAAHNEDFNAWWRDSGTEIHHFIGKDITYFHTLFWPAMLHVAGLRTPDRVQIHGFLTVNGEKMSKTKGTFVNARTYLDHLDPTYLRYYYASKLGARTDDIDMNLEEFAAKVNSDLVGKLVNLASRTARFVADTGLSPSYPDDGGLFATAAEAGEEIAAHYERCEYAQVCRRVMALADAANEYVESAAPWALRKDPALAQRLQDVCTIALNLFRQLMVYLTPVLPEMSRATGELLAAPITAWSDATVPLAGSPVGAFKHLLKRVDPKRIEAMIKDTRKAADEAAATTRPAAAPTAEPVAAEIAFDAFAAVDLRVARVATAEHVDGADKLLRLELDLGALGRRSVFAGIKRAYAPEQLVDRLVVCVANLAPRKMKFGLSEGMILAAGPGGEDLWLLAPDSGAQPGMRIA
ncbi:MAG: methionine--tRNA ligase [Thermodesulfobacteriota bacterium]